MPSDFVIKPFLESHKSKVMGMMLMEYNERETMDLFREEGKQEGLQEERQEGEHMLAVLINILLKQGRLSDVEKAAADPEYRNELYAKYNLTPESAGQS